MRFVLAFLVVCLLSPLLAYAEEAKRVIVSGTGGTRELALNNAFRHAVEQAVGMMVSSESYVKNLKDIQDKIFVASDGFIESYEVVNEDHDVTGYAVTVSAVVREKKLSSSVGTVTGVNATLNFDSSIYANLLLSENKSQQYHQIIIDALDDLLLHGLQFQHERLGVYERQDGYYVDLGMIKLVTNKYWATATKKYRERLGGSADSDDFKRALKGFPSPRSYPEDEAEDSWANNGFVRRWFMGIVTVKDTNGNAMSDFKFGIPSRSPSERCDGGGNFRTIDEYLGFDGKNLDGRLVNILDTKSNNNNVDCQFLVGPFDKDDIAKIKSVDFAVGSRVDYGGKVPLLNPFKP